MTILDRKEMRLREVKPKVTQLISGAAERPSQHPGLLSPLGHSLLPALTRTRMIFSKLAGQGTIFFFFFAETAVTTVLPRMVYRYHWCFNDAPPVSPMLVIGKGGALAFPISC